MRLDDRPVRIGGSEDDDIVLDAFGPGRIVLTLRGSTARLQAEGLEIDAHGRDGMIHVADGGCAMAPLPLTVAFGSGTFFHVRRTVQRRTAGTVALAGLAIPVAVAIVFGGVAVANLLPQRAVGQADTGPLATGSPVVAAFGALQEPDAAADNQVAADPATAARSLEEMAVRAGLSGLRAVPGDGVIRIEGHVSASQAGAWADLRQAYDRSFGLTVPMLIDVAETPEAPPLSVAAIWLGEPPEVVTREGHTLRLGEATEDGWTVAAIRSGAVELTRAGQRVVIEF